MSERFRDDGAFEARLSLQYKKFIPLAGRGVSWGNLIASVILDLVGGRKYENLTRLLYDRRIDVVGIPDVDRTMPEELLFVWHNTGKLVDKFQQ